MIRIIFLLLLLAGLAFGFNWISERPGVLSLNWQGQIFEVQLTVAIVALIIFIVTIMVLWAIIRAILDSPGLLSNYLSRKKQQQGYDALSQGFLAAGSGDSATARRMLNRASSKLNNEPMTELLAAQTALLDDKHDEAKAKFTDMLDDERTRMLALRGLYLEAAKDEDGSAARQFAEKATQLSPKLAWAGKAKQEFAATSGEWDAALDALEANKRNQIVSKLDYTRQRAVLLAANAMSVELSEPKLARKQALEALKLAPTLVPAGLVAARVMARAGEVRSALRLLEGIWRARPHPQVARAVMEVRAGESAVDRLKRAQRLMKLRPNHAESHYILAVSALDAKEFDLARESAKALITSRPTEAAYLLMADIEDAEFDDDSVVREWLSRAVSAPRDEAWIADGHISEHWAPLSPLTGRLDAFEWKSPSSDVSQSTSQIDWTQQEADLMSRRAALEAPEPVAEPEILDAEILDDVVSEDVDEIAGDANAEVKAATDKPEEASQEAEAELKKEKASKKKRSEGKQRESSKIVETSKDKSLVQRPDDPGVRDESKALKDGRHSVFK